MTFSFFRSNWAKTSLKWEVGIAPDWNPVFAGACFGVLSLTWHCSLLSTYWHALGELDLFCCICFGLFTNVDILHVPAVVHD